MFPYRHKQQYEIRVNIAWNKIKIWKNSMAAVSRPFLYKDIL